MLSWQVDVEIETLQRNEEALIEATFNRGVDVLRRSFVGRPRGPASAGTCRAARPASACSRSARVRGLSWLGLRRNRAAYLLFPTSGSACLRQIIRAPAETRYGSR